MNNLEYKCFHLYLRDESNIDNYNLFVQNAIQILTMYKNKISILNS